MLIRASGRAEFSSLENGCEFLTSQISSIARYRGHANRTRGQSTGQNARATVYQHFLREIESASRSCRAALRSHRARYRGSLDGLRGQKYGRRGCQNLPRSALFCPRSCLIGPRLAPGALRAPLDGLREGLFWPRSSNVGEIDTNAAHSHPLVTDPDKIAGKTDKIACHPDTRAHAPDTIAGHPDTKVVRIFSRASAPATARRTQSRAPENRR